MEAQLKDFDHFFYYGQTEIDIEVKIDVMNTIFQPKRLLFYNRNLDAAGVDEFENNPNTISLGILLPFAIIEAMANRNNYVSNGENDTRDRRAFSSQALIRAKQNNNNVDVTVQYIPGYDLRQTDAITTQIGGVA